MFLEGNLEKEQPGASAGRRILRIHCPGIRNRRF